jgi:hypothetical protein
MSGVMQSYIFWARLDPPSRKLVTMTTPVEQQLPRLSAVTDSTGSVEILGNRAGLLALLDGLNHGHAHFTLEPPDFDYGVGFLVMTAMEIAAAEGLIVVSGHGELLRIEGAPEKLQGPLGRGIANMLAAASGVFESCHFEPVEYQGFAKSSLSVEVFKD